MTQNQNQSPPTDPQKAKTFHIEQTRSLQKKVNFLPSYDKIYALCVSNSFINLMFIQTKFYEKNQ